ncbi:DUF4435 domain-containing protein [Vibrio sp. 3-2(1)]|uniref:DUF4435 domain-containing protein n=1 Tax=Vibrio sp. 3-2(1) TaxID=2591016 RepID=UPI0014820414|nr:DUF4435 domain-containing protein [Vibrio sp. 3-2(1)]NNN70520.1 DUF4435 domain-containing protein [Vibrio sp. 3-2(1)]
MLQRSTDARTTKALFFQHLNDIDIYVEDTAYGYEKLLTSVFSRLLAGKYKVGKVFPLGSRKEVLKQYEHKISKISRPTLYVVDGDLFILSGDSIKNKNGLYKFPFYCFENLICQEQAILDVLNEEEVVLYRDEIEERFNFTEWNVNNVEHLFELFLTYATVMVLKPTIQTVGLGVKPFISDKYGNISAEKLRNRIDDLQKELTEEFGEQTVSKATIAIKQRFDTMNCSKFDVISGKDYLFPLLKLRAKSVVSTRISDLNFKLRLTNKAALEPISECEQFIAAPVAA